MNAPETQPEPLPQASGSAPTAACAKEMWEVFTRHRLTYEQCINVMVATTKMIGRKANNDPASAFVLFLHKSLKVCPDLSELAAPIAPNGQALPQPADSERGRSK